MKRFCRVLLGVALIGSAVIAEVQAQSSPRMSIDVSTRRNRRQIGAGDAGQAHVENVSLRIRIIREGGQASVEPLTAEVYVIGRQIHTRLYGIIDVIKQDFDFSENRQFEFTTRQYALGRTDGNINVGGVYETFLVVVTNEKGEILETRSGRAIRDRGVALIREMGPKTLFDRDGYVVGEITDKNAAFRSAVPAAVSSGSNN